MISTISLPWPETTGRTQMASGEVKTTEGWAVLAGSHRTSHYFRNGISLCRHWGILSGGDWLNISPRVADLPARECGICRFRLDHGDDDHKPAA